MSKVRIPVKKDIRGTTGVCIGSTSEHQQEEMEKHQAQLEKVAAAAIALPPGLTDLEHEAQLLKDADHPNQGCIVHSYTFVTPDGESITFSVAGPMMQFGEPPRIVTPPPVLSVPKGV